MNYSPLEIGPHDMSIVSPSYDTLDVHPRRRLTEASLCESREILGIMPLQGAEELFGLRQGQPELLEALVVFVELSGWGLLVPEPTHGRSAAKVWRLCTPAMAAGLTDHVWSLKEVLCYRVPPWPQPPIV